MTDKGIDRAAICGVSFGGLIAVRFAAQHPDADCSALVLASTPQPALRLRRRHQIYLRAPWIFGPVFLAESPWRLRPEICAAIPDRAGQAPLCHARAPHAVLARRCRSPGWRRARGSSPASTRGRTANGSPRRRSSSPASAASTMSSRSRARRTMRAGFRNARAVVLERTGHLGSITRPEAFTDLVREFVVRCRASAPRADRDGRVA